MEQCDTRNGSAVRGALGNRVGLSNSMEISRGSDLQVAFPCAALQRRKRWFGLWARIWSFGNDLWVTCSCALPVPPPPCRADWLNLVLGFSWIILVNLVELSLNLWTHSNKHESPPFEFWEKYGYKYSSITKTWRNVIKKRILRQLKPCPPKSLFFHRIPQMGVHFENYKRYFLDFSLKI